MTRALWCQFRPADSMLGMIPDVYVSRGINKVCISLEFTDKMVTGQGTPPAEADAVTQRCFVHDAHLIYINIIYNLLCVNRLQYNSDVIQTSKVMLSKLAKKCHPN